MFDSSAVQAHHFVHPTYVSGKCLDGDYYFLII